MVRLRASTASHLLLVKVPLCSFGSDAKKKKTNKKVLQQIIPGKIKKHRLIHCCCMCLLIVPAAVYPGVMLKVMGVCK